MFAKKNLSPLSPPSFLISSFPVQLLQRWNHTTLPGPLKTAYPRKLKPLSARLAGPGSEPVIEALDRDDECSDSDSSSTSILEEISEIDEIKFPLNSKRTHQTIPLQNNTALHTLLDTHNKARQRHITETNSIRQDIKTERASMRVRYRTIESESKGIHVRDVSSRAFPSMIYTRKDGFKCLNSDATRRSLFVRNNQILIPLPSRLTHIPINEVTAEMPRSYRLRTTWETNQSTNQKPKYFHSYTRDGITTSLLTSSDP
jgi:hypothetical protein